MIIIPFPDTTTQLQILCYPNDANKAGQLLFIIYFDLLKLEFLLHYLANELTVRLFFFSSLPIQILALERNFDEGNLYRISSRILYTKKNKKVESWIEFKCTGQQLKLIAEELRAKFEWVI